jgi:Tfp pilus assembly protein PilF
MLYELLGQVYAAQKDYPKAEEAYHKALSLDKNRFSAYSRLADLYIAQKSFDKAVLELQKLLEANPRFGQIHVVLGVIYQTQRNQEKAKYPEALKIDSGLAVAASNLAWMLCESGNLKL